MGSEIQSTPFSGETRLDLSAEQDTLANVNQVEDKPEAKEVRLKPRYSRSEPDGGYFSAGLGTDYRYSSGKKDHSVDARLDVEGALLWDANRKWGGKPYGSLGAFARFSTAMPSLEDWKFGGSSQSHVDIPNSGVALPMVTGVVGVKFNQYLGMFGVDTDLGIGVRHEFESGRTIPVVAASVGGIVPFTGLVEVQTTTTVTVEEKPDVTVGAQINISYQ